MIKDFQAEFKGKTVLVTGSGRGIGYAIAMEFAKRGASLAIQSRDEARLARAAQALKAVTSEQIFSQVTDLQDEAASIAAIQAVLEKFGKIDVLVNNAGIYQTAPVEGHPTQLWDEIMTVNLRAAFLYCREVIAKMKAQSWGRIINIASISGKHAEIHGAAYSASKFGMIGLTQSLALELATHGITVNAICPGWVNTDMANQQLLDDEWCKLNGVEPAESLEIARLSVPQMRFIEPEEVGNLAVYLASDLGRGITGQAINICGGMCLS